MPLVMTPSGPVLFAHVPKCAGTSVEHYLASVFGPLALRDPRHNSLPAARRWSRTSPQHADAVTLERLFPAGFLHASFAVVRHPVQRLISVFRFQRDIEGRIDPDTRFEDWLLRLPDLQRKPWLFDNHILPMCAMVPNDAQVFRLEDGWDPLIDWLQQLAGPARELPRNMPLRNVLEHRLRRDGRSAPSVTAGAEARAIILSLFGEDFLRFGYDMQLDR